MDASSTTALLALGANLGDPVHALRSTRHNLAAHEGMTAVQASSMYWTDPVGGPPGQPPYLNAVLQLETRLSADHLLRLALAMEADLGRVRDERWGPRTLDIDLLDVGGRISNTDVLTLPHPEMHRRPFVLIPLAEVAPDWQHPMLKKTARALLDELSPDTGVRVAMEAW